MTRSRGSQRAVGGAWGILHDTPAGAPQLREARWEPATDLYQVGGGFVLKLEVAGVSAEDLDITSEGRILRIRGQRPNACLGPDCEFRQVEIAYGCFERAFEFPFPLDDATVEASCRDGMLLVRVGPPTSPVRRIAVQPSADTQG
ncbi:MAG: Hsp20/alpha crystallin family protein [Fimbriimonadaceae bacterium]|nr:Hsp20/alpha crystallin family protein [Fimbriimonadaceae bacterium]